MPLDRWRRAIDFRDRPGTLRCQPERVRRVAAADKDGAAQRGFRNVWAVGQDLGSSGKPGGWSRRTAPSPESSEYGGPFR